MPPDLVVKFGGSFARTEARAEWLATLSSAAGKIVLVPGGGPFADTVRAEQAAQKFSDRAAHRMALLAMNQFGLAIADTSPVFAPADSLAAIAASLRAGKTPVWLPWPMLCDAPDIPESWEVTSDSLALWLALRLDAPRLLLVKQARGGLDLADAAFPRFLAGYGGAVFVAGPQDWPKNLDGRAPPGAELARRSA